MASSGTHAYLSCSSAQVHRDQRRDAGLRCVLLLQAHMRPPAPPPPCAPGARHAGDGHRFLPPAPPLRAHHHLLGRQAVLPAAVGNCAACPRGVGCAG